MLNTKKFLYLSLITTAAFAGSFSAMADESGLDDTAAAPPMPAPIVQAMQRQNYQPTIVHSLDEVQALYNTERALAHDSQCFERAEVWSYEMSSRAHMMKVMMFYTERFRHNFKHSGFWGDKIYKWWFHTAPVIYADLNDGKGPVAYVLDSEFVDKPVTLDEWSYYFLHDEIMPNNRNIPYVDKNLLGRGLTPEETHCQVISNFREYAMPAIDQSMDGPWCQMRIYPMYYMTPLDVQRMDCDLVKDPNYTMGITGKHGTGIGRSVYQRTRDGKAFYYPCAPLTMTDFDKDSLSQAYKSAHSR